MRKLLIGFACVLAAPELIAQQGAGGFDADQWKRAIRLGNGAGIFNMRGPRGHRPHRDATTAALVWLRDNQATDGSWRSRHAPDTTVAVTSVAILAMLSDGSTMRAGPWKSSIKNGIRWLRDSQKASGAFAQATGPHLLASLAMTEAYVLSNYKLIKKNAVKALEYAAARRAKDGGWSASAAVERSDPALTVWGAALLGTAAFGDLIDPNDPNQDVLEWLCGPQANVIPELGVLGAEPPVVRWGELAFDQAAANAFTFYWTKTRNKDGKPKDLAAKAAERYEAALARIRKAKRTWQKDPKNKLSISEWFASSHALALAGDDDAVAELCKALVAAQIKGGGHNGTWEPIGVWGEAGGRAWTTAMAAMTLAAPYRYAKLHLPK